MGGQHFFPFMELEEPNLPSNYWLGLTDLLVERGTNRSGWLWSDGSREMPSSNVAWYDGEPNEGHADCALQCNGTGHVCDFNCGELAIPMCQPKSLKSSTSQAADFQAVPIPVGLSADGFAQGGGCSKLISKVSSEMECARVCMREPMVACVGFYINEAKKECLLLLYTDATVDLGDTYGWMKFVLKK